MEPSMSGTGSCGSNNKNVDEIVKSVVIQLQYHISHKETQSKFWISKVSEQFRMADRKSFEPIIISFGPYHHRNPALLAMEKEKWNCLDYMLKINKKKTLEDYLDAIGELLNEARQYYSHEIKMDANSFLQMLVLDGCYILVTLNREYLTYMGPVGDSSTSSEVREKDLREESELHVGDEEVSKKYSRSLSRSMKFDELPAYNDIIGPWYSNFLAHDLLLLENQIPFFVVQRLCDLLTEGENANIPINHKIALYVENCLQYYPRGIQDHSKLKDFQHILHLCHMYFRPNHKLEVYYQQRDRPQHWFHHFVLKGSKYLMLRDHLHQNEKQKRVLERRLLGRWHSSKQYHEAGIIFRKRELNRCSPHSLLDIKFTKGLAEIPCLVVDENTGALFRNLIALEQSCRHVGKDFTAYIAFISQLMSTPMDVTFLGQRGIIIHELRSDEEVCKLIASLGKNVDFDINSEHYLKNVFWMMEEHYQDRLNRWMAWLFQNHFSNPWLVLAVLAAAVVLLCTVVQTLFAFLAYFNPTSASDSS